MLVVSKSSATLAALATLAVAVPVYSQTGSDAGGGAQSSQNQSPQDAEIARRVYDKLNSDPVNYYKHVTVRAENGVVTLGGIVWSDIALNKAKKLASSVPGVKKVVDQMQLERNPANEAPGR